jgi:hypothetical protein
MDGESEARATSVSAWKACNVACVSADANTSPCIEALRQRRSASPSGGAWISCMMRSPTVANFRVLTVVAQWSRHSPILEVATNMSGQTVSVALGRVIGAGAAPRSITVDDGTEFMSRALEDWAHHRALH